MTDEEKQLARKAQAYDYYHNWGGREYWRQKYYLARRNEYCERSRAYYQAHKEERLAYQRAYRARKKAEKQAERSDNQ